MLTMPETLLSVRLLGSGIIWTKVSVFLVNRLYKTDSKDFLSMNYHFLLTITLNLKENNFITSSETEIKIIVTLLSFIFDHKGRGLQ